MHYPFQNNVGLEIFGSVLMLILIALSNAGGLSGAGTNIPIMLICFSMEMEEAVPISGFVAVTATVFRFILNYNQKHPGNPERNSINYEVVMITMPCVFLGSFIGVWLSNNVVGEITKVVIFGLTVSWSIKTTSAKACELIAKERKQAAKLAADAQEKLLNAKSGDQENKIKPLEVEDVSVVANTPEMQAILYEEKYHFTTKRVIFTILSFLSMYVTQTIFKQYSATITNNQKMSVFLIFAFVVLMMTRWSLNEIMEINRIKQRDGTRLQV